MKTIIAKLWGITVSVFNFYAPILREVAATSIASLLPIALDIVRSLADSDKTNTQKREAAVKALTQAAIRNGIDASESLIRFTIESAVQKAKLDS